MAEKILLAGLAYLLLYFSPGASACSRVLYTGPEGTVLTARSMDWADEIPVNLWIFPRGMERSGKTGENSFEWTSKYGSVVASSFNISSPDGLNEKGLAANALWLAEARYPEYDGSQKGMTVAAWAQYVLDSFATVSEAVRALSREEFVVVSDYVPGTDRFATLHLAISDASGDSAVFEYIDGELVVYHDRSYNVMTNSPVFSEQLALDRYWRQIGGTVMLPGTNRAADRFVRASFYLDAIPQTSDTREAVASVFSVIRNVSVPYGISSEEEPNISSTRWRSLADHKNLVYYFETALTPNTFWVDLEKADFSGGAPVMKLSLENYETYAGDALGSFVESEPFEFLGIED